MGTFQKWSYALEAARTHPKYLARHVVSTLSCLIFIIDGTCIFLIFIIDGTCVFLFCLWPEQIKT